MGRLAVWAAVTSWSGRLTALAVGFLVTPFVLHRLGDAQYGLFMLVSAVMGHGALLDFGIRPAVIKYVAEHRARGENDRLRSLLATAVVIYCCLGLLALLMTAALAPVFPNLFNVPASEHKTAATIVWLMGIWLAISIPCNTSWAVLWGLHKYGLANAINVLATLVSAAATVAILALGGGLIEMVAASIPVTLGTQAITLWCAYRIAPELRFGWRAFRRELVRTVLSFSGSMFAIDVSYNVQTGCDEIVIGAFLPVSSVGPYSIARRLSGVPQLVAQQAFAGFIPLTSQLQAEGDSDRLRSLYLIGSRITLAICVPLAGVLIVLAGPLLTLWVGAEYAGYASLVLILTLASVAEVCHWPGQSILQGLGRHHGLAAAYVCAAFAKVGLAVVLVQSHGLTGVAFATFVCAMALSFGFVFPYTMRTLGVTARALLQQALLPVLVPAVAMMGLLYGIVWILQPRGLIPVGCTAMAGLAAYAVAYVGFCAGAAERKLLRSFVAKMAG
jgi:O-antigen/teichoic acid export membrane protein